MNIGLFSKNEISDSIDGVVDQRMHTPIYGVFFLSWAALHAGLIYTAFFVDQDLIYKKYHLLRVEYLHQEFFNLKDPLFYLGWLAPFLITWLVIWYLPKLIGLPAFRKEEQYKNEKKAIAIEEATKIEAAELKLEKKNVEKLEVSTEKAEKEQNLVKLDPSLVWQEEYEKFKRTTIFNKFQEIIDAIYEHQGLIKDDYFNGVYNFEVSQRVLVYGDTNGLVTLNNTANPTIKLTEKGKYFVSRFTADKVK